MVGQPQQHAHNRTHAIAQLVCHQPGADSSLQHTQLFGAKISLSCCSKDAEHCTAALLQLPACMFDQLAPCHIACGSTTRQKARPPAAWASEAVMGTHCLSSGSGVTEWLARSLLLGLAADSAMWRCRVPEDMQGTATFLAKADGVLAGLAVADLVSPTACSSQHVLASVATCVSAFGRMAHTTGGNWPVAAGCGPTH